MGKLREYLEKEFGMPCDIRENSVTNSVAALNTLVLRNDPDRLFWLVINLSAANTLYLYWRPVSAVPAGAILGAGGGGLSVNARDHGILPEREVFAGASAYPTSIYVLEVFGV